MDEKQFLDGQFIAFRTLYYRYRFVRRATFIRLAASVAAVVNLMANRTPLGIAASAVVLLVANLENISMIPALSRLRIRRELGAWEGSCAFRLSMQQDTLLFASEKSAVDHSGRQDQPVREGRSVLHHRVEQLPGGHPAGECGAVARNGGSAPQDRRAPLFHINPYVPAEQLRDRRKITK